MGLDFRPSLDGTVAGRPVSADVLAAVRSWTPEMLAAKKPAPRPEVRITRTWAGDRWMLDADATPPPCSPTARDLASIHPILFWCWNRATCRWEVWGHRPSTLLMRGVVGYTDDEPYFVFNVAHHPTVRDDFGRIIAPCPSRPKRWRNTNECPKECPGVYAVADSRILRILWAGKLDTLAGPEAVVDSLERWEKQAEDRLDSRIESLSHDAVDRVWNRTAGVESAGYTGKVFRGRRRRSRTRQ